MARYRQTSATALFALWASVAWAQAPVPALPDGGFHLPVECRLTEDCWIANYFDVVKGPGEADFRCSSRTYDDHNGVDIAVRDWKAMMRGVPVLAGAAGIVAFTRDGETDGAFAKHGPQATNGRDCGNAVVIDYGNGWNAQFCHLREGSLRVQKGDRVTPATPIGLVGMSGKAAFPHVHWTLRHGRIDLDPFTGKPAGSACSIDADARSLWHPTTNIAYEPFSLYASGFAAQAPTTKDIINDAQGSDTLPAGGRTIGIWAAIFGVREGDKITLSAVDPVGASFVNSERVVTRTQALHIPYVARVKRDDKDWQSGRYRASVTIERRIEDRLVRQSREMAVEIR